MYSYWTYANLNIVEITSLATEVKREGRWTRSSPYTFTLCIPGTEIITAKKKKPWF
jgi:hypothetical protein